MYVRPTPGVPATGFRWSTAGYLPRPLGTGTRAGFFFTPGRRWVEKPLLHSFEPRFESRRPDIAKRRLALGVGTQSQQDPTESRAADHG